LNHFGAKTHRIRRQGKKVTLDCFSACFQMVKRLADIKSAPFRSHYQQALDFVIDNVIRKYTATRI